MLAAAILSVTASPGNMKKNIAIVMGGFSTERQISLKSGNVVYQHLNRDRFSPYRVIIDKDAWYYLDDSDNQHKIDRSDFSLELNGKKIEFHCVFNAIHGTPGEDGILQAYLELLGIPQTSCDFYQAALTFNKRDLLSVLSFHGIKSAENFFLNKGDEIDKDAIVKAVGLPCFVKANRAGSSFGISKVYKEEDIAAALEKAFEEDHQILIERALEGTEVSVGVITYKNQVTVLPITEIVSENDFFDYEAKYEGKSDEITPARISEKEAELVRRLAKKAYKVLGLKGYTRSEFILENGQVYLLEVNTTPGLTEESILPQQARVAGISLEDLFGSSIDEALS